MSEDATNQVVDDIDGDEYGVPEDIYADPSDDLALENTDVTPTEGSAENADTVAADDAQETTDALPEDDVTQDTEYSADDVPADDNPEQDAPADSGFDAALLQAVGLEESQAKSQFGTPEALRNAVRLLDQQSVSLGAQLLQQQNAQQHAQQQVQQQAPPPAQQVQQPQQSQTPTPDNANQGFKLPELPDDEEWGDEVKAAFESLNAHFEAKFAHQQQVIDQQRQATEQFLLEKQRASQSNYVEEFDSFVNNLGKEWDGVLGKGSGSEMDPNSLQINNRIHLDQVANQLAMGQQAKGLPPLPKSDLLNRALGIAFPDQQEQAVRKQVVQEVEKRQRMKTNRPGSSMKKQLSGEEIATSYADKWYAKQGLDALPGDEFEYDEI
jgi:hypothetical protein